jgi:hypothetical protein
MATDDIDAQTIAIVREARERDAAAATAAPDSRT